MLLLPFKKNCLHMCKQKTKCICWLFNDLQRETKHCGKYGMKIQCPFLLLDLNVSAVVVKVGLEEKIGLISCSA